MADFGIINKSLTTPFNNMRTLPSTVNQMFGGCSNPPTTVERAVIKSSCTIQTTKQCSAAVGSWESACY